MTVLLFDANYLLASSMFAMKYPRRDLQDRNRAEAAFNFINRAGQAMERLNATQCIFFWDGGKSKRRMKRFPKYKSSRKKKQVEPDGILFREQFKDQCSIIKEITDPLRIGWIQFYDREADDVIIRAIHLLREHEVMDRIYVVSGDKDLLQAVDTEVFVFRPQDKSIIVPDNFADIMGIDTDNYVLARAVTGEKSRNDIDGVPGVGDKTIMGLLGVDSVEDVYDLPSLINYCSRPGASKKEAAIPDHFEIICRNLFLLDLEQEVFNEKEDSEMMKVMLKTPGSIPMNRIIKLLRKWNMQRFLININAFIFPYNILRGIELYAPQDPVERVARD